MGSFVSPGPFRDYDGVLMIDHGGGWISLIVNALGSLRAGDRVNLGDGRLAERSGRSRSNCPKMGGESRQLSSQVHLNPVKWRERRLNRVAAEWDAIL